MHGLLAESASGSEALAQSHGGVSLSRLHFIERTQIESGTEGAPGARDDDTSDVRVSHEPLPHLYKVGKDVPSE
ncbi:hypothetical protein GCM10023190_18880 [Enteractinococcus fodinae]